MDLTSGSKAIACHLFYGHFYYSGPTTEYILAVSETLYDLLIKAAWQTVDSFARRDPKLKGRIGAHSVLHTHNRKLQYHPHVHMIVPAGVVDEKKILAPKGGAVSLFYA